MHMEGFCTHNREISKPDSDPQPLLVTAITCSCLEGHCLQQKSTPQLHLCHHVHRVLRTGTESCSFRRRTARLLPLQGPASALAPPETTRSCSQAQQEMGEPTLRSHRLPSESHQVLWKILSQPSRCPVIFHSSLRAAWKDVYKLFLNFILFTWPFESTLNTVTSTSFLQYVSLIV